MEDKRLRREYNISLEQWQTQFSTQGGRCAICQSDGERKLSVDHCHQTGKFRGLLCSRCNVGIGYLKDSPTYLRAAANYLESYQEN